MLKSIWQRRAADSDDRRMRSMLEGLLPALACSNSAENAPRAVSRPALRLVAGRDLEMPESDDVRSRAYPVLTRADADGMGNELTH